MKIVHLCLCGPYNDYWGYQDNMIPKYNKKDGHDVTIITSILINSTKSGGYEKVESGQHYLEDGIKVIRIPFKQSSIPKIVERLRIYEGLFSLLEKENPDLIFMHGVQFLEMNTVVKYIKNNPKCRLIADNHADYINSASNLFSKLLLHGVLWKRTINKSLPYIERIYGVTPNRCEFLNGMYDIPKEKIELLVMGADSEKIDFENRDDIRRRYREKLSLKEDDFIVITGGKIDKKKNIHYLMEAINKIGDNKLKLIVFGVPSDDMKLIIDKLSTNYIRNIGWIGSNEVYNYFLASDLAVFPGTHSVLWEQAVGTGLPCIFKTWDGMTHVDLGGNCIFINEGSVEELVCKITNIYGNEGSYNVIKEVAESEGIPYFSYEEISRTAIKKN